MKTKKKFLLSSVILLVVALVVLTFGNLPAAAADKIYRMKIQSAYPRGDLSMELLKDFAASADKRSKGRIKIQVFADPELVPGEQLFEATKKGTLTMLHAVAAMWGGIVPVGEVEFGLPYAYNLPGEPDVYQAGETIRSFPAIPALCVHRSSRLPACPPLGAGRRSGQNRKLFQTVAYL